MRPKTQGADGRAQPRRRGHTLIEAVIAVSTYSIFLIIFALTMNSVSEEAKLAEAEFELAREGFSIMESIRLDLQRAGWTEIGGVTWPVFQWNGLAEPGFEDFAHDAPAGNAREILLRQPADFDADGWPDTDGNGQITWGDAIGWLLVPQADGTDALTRRQVNGRDRLLGRHVTGLTFESPSDTAFVIPLDAVRVRLELMTEGPGGLVERLELEETVRLWNGGMEP